MYVFSYVCPSICIPSLVCTSIYMFVYICSPPHPCIPLCVCSFMCTSFCMYVSLCKYPPVCILPTYVYPRLYICVPLFHIYVLSCVSFYIDVSLLPCVRLSVYIFICVCAFPICISVCVCVPLCLYPIIYIFHYVYLSLYVSFSVCKSCVAYIPRNSPLYFNSLRIGFF